MAPENTLLGRVSPETARKKLGYGESIPLNPGVRHPVFWDAVLEQKPYPVKALLIMGTNPLLTSSDPLKGEGSVRY